MRLAPRLTRRDKPRNRQPRPELRTLDFPSSLLQVRVEISPGADLTAAPASWLWTDISEYVLLEGGISILQGKRDEAALVEPGSCRLTVLNNDGRFSRHNPAGPWYPLARNTPIRVLVNPGTGWYTRFEGFVDSWPETWDPTGSIHKVQLSCSGIMRRLGQGASPERSAYSRYTLTRPTLLEYWPCEDPAGSATAVNLAGGSPMVAQSATFGSNSSMAGSGALPTLSITGSLSGAVRAYTPASTGWAARIAFGVPSTPGAEIYLADVYTTGTLRRWRITLNPATTPDRLYVQWYDVTDTLVSSTYLEWPDSLYGTTLPIGMGARQNGTGIDLSMTYVSGGTATSTTVTIASQTIGVVTAVRVAPLSGLTGVTAGHVSVYSDSTAIFDIAEGADADAGDHAGTRITQLCTAENIPLVTSVGPGGLEGVNEGAQMGPQPVGSVLPLLRECEAVEGGILYEAGFGLGYQYIRSLYGQGVTLALDYTARHVAAIAPQDDDQRLRNDWTITRRSGSSARVVNAESVAAEGTYDSSATLNVRLDSVLADQASWRVHKGTLPGLRYPRLGIQLHRNPDLIHPWAACKPGSRMTVTGIPSAVTPDTADLIVEGWQERITSFTWDVDIVCSPARVYEVFRVGDTQLGRCGSLGSTLVADLGIGVTTFQVATPVGPLWTTARDLPVEIEIGGERMTAYLISGASSPQTFTVDRHVNDVFKNHAAGAAVRLWRPGVVALGVPE